MGKGTNGHEVPRMSTFRMCGLMLEVLPLQSKNYLIIVRKDGTVSVVIQFQARSPTPPPPAFVDHLFSFFIYNVANAHGGLSSYAEIPTSHGGDSGKVEMPHPRDQIKILF